MDVIEAKFISEKLIEAEFDEGKKIFPDDPGNRFRKAVSKWESEGGVIAPFDTRTNWRETAELSKRDFLLAVSAAKILPPDEAIAAARGDWPDTFQAAISSLPEADQTAAKIEWAATTSVSRNHSIIALLATAADLSDEQVDALFGYDG